MGRLTAQFRQWERPAQIAVLIALALLFGTAIVGIAAPPDTRLIVMIAFFGQLVVLQALIMWANRGMVTDFTRAQRFYLDEDFAAARDLLEARRAAGDATVHELTLLGNTYRQLGQLNASETVLLEALNNEPKHHYPLYGFGRTLMMQGDYDRAAMMFVEASNAGAPPLVNLDLAEAWYRGNESTQAGALLRQMETGDEQPNEPPRALMFAWLHHRLNRADPPPLHVIEAGLPYWAALAERFASTPYGHSLAADAAALQAIADEGKLKE